MIKTDKIYDIIGLTSHMNSVSQDKKNKMRNKINTDGHFFCQVLSERELSSKIKVLSKQSEIDYSFA